VRNHPIKGAIPWLKAKQKPSRPSNAKALKRLRLLPLATLLGLAVSVHGSDRGLCPDSIRVSVMPTGHADLPSGARLIATSEPQTLRVQGVSLYAGPPENLAVLVSEYRRTRTGNSERWHFEGTFPDGKYGLCSYADGLVGVALRLPDATTSCIAEYREKKLSQLSCQ